MKRILIALALLMLLAGSVPVVEGQGEMEIRFYMIPIDTHVPGYRGPLYLKWRMNPDGLDVQWSCVDYGSNLDTMVCAVNAETADHDYLTGQADVFAWTANLDITLTPSRRSALQTYLEGAFIPADWIGPSDTERTALRTITGMFLFMQRLTAILPQPIQEYVFGLNTQFINLDPVLQAAIDEAILTLGYDNSELKDNWTVRILLKNMADQWGTKPIHFGFTVL